MINSQWQYLTFSCWFTDTPSMPCSTRMPFRSVWDRSSESLPGGCWSWSLLLACCLCPRETESGIGRISRSNATVTYRCWTRDCWRLWLHTSCYSPQIVAYSGLCRRRETRPSIHLSAVSRPQVRKSTVVFYWLVCDDPGTSWKWILCDSITLRIVFQWAITLLLKHTLGFVTSETRKILLSYSLFILQLLKTK